MLFTSAVATAWDKSVSRGSLCTFFPLVSVFVSSYDWQRYSYDAFQGHAHSYVRLHLDCGEKNGLTAGLYITWTVLTKLLGCIGTKAPIYPSRLVRHFCPINAFACWEKNNRICTGEVFEISLWLKSTNIFLVLSKKIFRCKSEISHS